MNPPKRPSGRPRGRPRGRREPKHRLTPVWAKDIDHDQLARVLLSIAIAHLDEREQEEAEHKDTAAEAEHQEGGKDERNR